MASGNIDIYSYDRKCSGQLRKWRTVASLQVDQRRDLRRKWFQRPVEPGAVTWERAKRGSRDERPLIGTDNR